MAGGEETRGKVSKGLSADGRRSADAVRQHRRTGEGARHQSAAVVYVAREAGAAGEQWGPPANSREATLRKEVSQLKRVLAEKVLEVDFFKGALHTRRGATPAERHSWRAGIYAHIRDVMSRQGAIEYRADV